MNRFLLMSATAVLLLTGAALIPAGYERLIYNATDSAPLGWYLLQAKDAYFVGDEVLVDLPESAAKLAAERRYLPAGVPLLKRVGARGGQRICLRDHVVSIDGITVAASLPLDAAARPLPSATYCRLLLRNELFLLNPANAASFDSRYFGPIASSRIRGRAIPLWTWESP